MFIVSFPIRHSGVMTSLFANSTKLFLLEKFYSSLISYSIYIHFLPDNGSQSETPKKQASPWDSGIRRLTFFARNGAASTCRLKKHLAVGQIGTLLDSSHLQVVFTRILYGPFEEVSELKSTSQIQCPRLWPTVWTWYLQAAASCDGQQLRQSQLQPRWWHETIKPGAHSNLDIWSFAPRFQVNQIFCSYGTKSLWTTSGKMILLALGLFRDTHATAHGLSSALNLLEAGMGLGRA